MTTRDCLITFCDICAHCPRVVSRFTASFRLASYYYTPAWFSVSVSAYWTIPLTCFVVSRYPSPAYLAGVCTVTDVDSFDRSSEKDS